MSKTSSFPIVIVRHVSAILDPGHNLVEFLAKRGNTVVSIKHYLPDAHVHVPTSLVELKERRKTVTSRVIKKNMMRTHIRGPILIAENIILTIFLVLSLRRKVITYLGIGLLNGLIGIFLANLHIVKWTIFYSFDHSPHRFQNSLVNSIYLALDRICATRSTCVFNASERIGRLRQGMSSPAQRNIVVPIGVDLSKIGPKRKQIVKEWRLVYIGYLLESKGVGLILNALSTVAAKFPGVTLEIIGAGPDEKRLRKIVSEVGLDKIVKFLGVIDHDKLLSYLCSFRVGLAIYSSDVHNLTRFGDAIKPKEYLACGVPVIITRVPWISHLIGERELGLVIDYDIVQLANAIEVMLSDDKTYVRCKENALIYNHLWDLDRIYQEAFNKFDALVQSLLSS